MNVDLTVIIVALIIAITGIIIGIIIVYIKANENDSRFNAISVLLDEAIALDKKENYLAAKPYVNIIKIVKKLCDKKGNITT